MIFCILKTLGIWIVLVVVCINLVAFFVRGLLWRRYRIPEEVGVPARQVIERELVAPTVTANRILNLLGGAALAGLLYGLVRFGYPRLAIASAVLMIGRLPDLLWEIRIEAATGKKASTQKRPHGPVYAIAFLTMLGTVILVWQTVRE